mmetsp:Transcript_3475/g.7948  ORF Transcript_3475/g.7948 Transcript_3475/m.7948 type:complete len:202 (-) Transcript_3475:521-1126(-)
MFLFYRRDLISFVFRFGIRPFSLFFTSFFVVVVVAFQLGRVPCSGGRRRFSFLDFRHLGLELRQSVGPSSLLPLGIDIPQHPPALHRGLFPPVVDLETNHRQVLTSKGLGHDVHPGNERGKLRELPVTKVLHLELDVELRSTHPQLVDLESHEVCNAVSSLVHGEEGGSVRDAGLDFFSATTGSSRGARTCPASPRPGFSA